MVESGNDNRAAVMHDLAALGALPDDALDLGAAALLLAALDHPGVSLDRYRAHLDALAAAAGDCHAEILRGGAADDADSRVAALRKQKPR